MTKAEALKLLRSGKDGIAEWNCRREAAREIPSLRKALLRDADLSKADLRDADLSDAALISADLSDADLSDADLSGAHLMGANLIRANLSGANLSGAYLSGANLSGAYFSGAYSSAANLSGAYLSGADLSSAYLSAADLSGVQLRNACLRSADLSDADLCDADLDNARLSNTSLSGADLAGATFIGADLKSCDLTKTNLVNTRWGWTTLADVDLGEAHGLDTAVFDGPCSVGVDTLVRSKGQIPESFLRSCGFQRWQILEVRLYDPAMTAGQIAELQCQIFEARAEGPIFLGGVFISYSHANEDKQFVEKIHDRLKKEGAPVWLDRHDMIAGDLQKQVSRAIRLYDVVLLVLSESSVNSDWVEHELELAINKEKAERRDVLCPVSLDDSWKTKMNDVLWRQVKKKNVLDFSKWKTKAFEPAYKKLTAGLKINYGPAAGESAPGAT